jgi:hypothetical protein
MRLDLWNRVITAHLGVVDEAVDLVEEIGVLLEAVDEAVDLVVETAVAEEAMTAADAIGKSQTSTFYFSNK